MFGEQDFIQYWTAFKFFINGENPYDIEATRALQCSLGHDCDQVLVSWNPPWLLILMSPVLLLPFTMAAKGWVVVGFALSAAAAFLVADCYRQDLRSTIYALIGVFINAPLLLSAGFGQTGSLLLFAAALLLHGRVKSGSSLQQAIALVLLSVKPHLFILVAAALLWDELRRKQLRIVFQSASILAFFSAVLIVVNPMILPTWLDHIVGKSDTDGILGLTEWNTPTLGNLLRHIAQQFSEGRADTFLFFTPAAAAAGLAWWLWRNPSIDWRCVMPPLIALSLWFAPYGWAYDWAVLGVLQASLLCWLATGGADRTLWSATAVIVGTQFTAGYMTLRLQLTLDKLIWLPAVLLVLWYIAGRKAGERELPTHGV
jgi:hypothetical protein